MKVSSLYKSLLYVSAVALLAGCNHPLQIKTDGVAKGDITSSSGIRNCSYDEAVDIGAVDIGDNIRQCDNEVIENEYGTFTAVGAYNETYTAEPKFGSLFDTWENCLNGEDGLGQIFEDGNRCSYNIPAATVRDNWGNTAGPLIAKFSESRTRNNKYLDEVLAKKEMAFFTNIYFEEDPGPDGNRPFKEGALAVLGDDNLDDDKNLLQKGDSYKSAAVGKSFRKDKCNLSDMDNVHINKDDSDCKRLNYDTTLDDNGDPILDGDGKIIDPIRCQYPENINNQDCYRIDATRPHAKFRIKCEFSHLNYDDPILFPGDPKAAHLHMYFGNTHADADSTYETLIDKGNSTCNGGELNRTAYWVPALLNSDGDALIPNEIFVYYKNRDAHKGDTVAYPDDLKLIAKTSPPLFAENDPDNPPETHTTGNTDPFPITSFGCGTRFGGDVVFDRNINNVLAGCVTNGNEDGGTEIALEMKVQFPQCYKVNSNYNADDPNDSKYNVAYRYKSFELDKTPDFQGNDCPDGYEKVSSIEYRLFWHVTSHRVPGSNQYAITDVRLSSDKPDQDPGMSGHADWYGAWNKEVMAKWLQNCNNFTKLNVHNPAFGSDDEALWDCETGVLRRGPNSNIGGDTDPEGLPTDVRLYECTDCISLQPRETNLGENGKFTIAAQDIREELCPRAGDLTSDDKRHQISHCPDTPAAQHSQHTGTTIEAENMSLDSRLMVDGDVVKVKAGQTLGIATSDYSGADGDIDVTLTVTDEPNGNTVKLYRNNGLVKTWSLTANDSSTQTITTNISLEDGDQIKVKLFGNVTFDKIHFE